MGVEIFPGFAASEILFGDENEVRGIITGDMGVDKDGKEINEILTSSEKEDIKTNVYLEDWSNGMRNSKDYVIDLINFLLAFKNASSIIFGKSISLISVSIVCFSKEYFVFSY